MCRCLFVLAICFNKVVTKKEKEKLNHVIVTPGHMTEIKLAQFRGKDLKRRFITELPVGHLDFVQGYFVLFRFWTHSQGNCKRDAPSTSAFEQLQFAGKLTCLSSC